MRSIPFGPETKDPPWRWGSFLVGVVTFVVLFEIARLGSPWLLGWWSIVFVILGYLLSARSGRAWARGVPHRQESSKKRQPTVAIEGREGATYVLLEPGKSLKPRVKPREFSPGWWALYSAVVRAPVALGDFVLTLFWRFTSSFWATSSATEQALQFEHPDLSSRMDSPDRDTF